MKIAHITIHTAKLEESVKFYSEVLGLSIKVRFSTPDGKNIVFLSGGEDDAAIELITDEDHPFDGKGISIGFHVQEVESAHEQMESSGLNPSPIISPNPQTKFFFITDPNGVSIQLI